MRIVNAKNVRVNLVSDLFYASEGNRHCIFNIELAIHLNKVIVKNKE